MLTSRLLIDAVTIFLGKAYANESVPASRQAFTQMESARSVEENLAIKWVEATEESTGQKRWALRIGNAWYPHMKLVISPMGEGGGVVFSVDAHDALSLPAGSPEESAFRELQRKNRELAADIESAWESAGVPTQAGLLKRYLDDAKGDDSSQDGVVGLS